MKRNITLLFSILILSYSCKNEDFDKKDFPSLFTFDAENVDENGATFKAEITQNRNSEVIKLGFIWGKSSGILYEKDTIYVETKNEGIFYQNIDYALPANEEISFYSYAQTSDYEVIGNIRTFISKGCKLPTITDFYPKHGSDGEMVTIEGNDFTSAKSVYKILFGDKNGKILSASKNKITVEVPQNYSVPGKCQLNLKMYNENFAVGEFELDSLIITNINSTDFIIAESTVEITFNNKVYYVGNVTIGGINIDTKSIYFNENKIYFILPNYLPGGEQELSMTVNNKHITYGNKLNLYSPWTRKKDCPENLSASIIPNGFANNENIIFNVPLSTGITGVRGGNNVYWEYNPQADEWTLKYENTHSTILRTGFFSFSFNDNYYWGGGLGNINYTDNLYINKYSPTNNTNELVFNFRHYLIYDAQNHTYPQMLYSSAFEINNNAYILGGLLSTDYPELPFFKYSETNEMEKLKSFDNTFDYKYWYGATGFVINGKLYFGTGVTDKGLTSEFWCYDPVADSWTKLPDFPSDSRCFSVGFSINGKGYIGLGSTDDWNINTSNSLKDIWEFNPANNTWKELANFPGGGKSGASTVVLNNKAYICFGNNNSDLWEFDPTVK